MLSYLWMPRERSNAVQHSASAQPTLEFLSKASLARLCAFMQVGASYLCNKGQLGDNEPVGNRTDMFAAETVREITRKLAAQDPVKAQAFKITMDLAKSKLCQEMGEEVRKEFA